MDTLAPTAPKNASVMKLTQRHVTTLMDPVFAKMVGTGLIVHPTSMSARWRINVHSIRHVAIPPEAIGVLAIKDIG